MPELPEVEVARLGIAPAIENQQITGAVVRAASLRLPLDPHLGRKLAGLTVERLRRRGKYLLLDCGAGTLLIHLGMSGSLRLVAADTPAEKHDHFDLQFSGRTLRLRDPRRFGVVAWICGDPAAHPLLAPLGIEPLADGFTPEWLLAATRKRNAPIKPVLMDAHLVVGIGNIYAAESLFRAGIDPRSPASRISRLRYRRLVPAIRDTLAAAIAAGGSSVRDYVHSDGGAGCFQLECAVYDRAGKPCGACGRGIRQIRQAGRSTFFCPGCQK